jgi:hypothetical protein
LIPELKSLLQKVGPFHPQEEQDKAKPVKRPKRTTVQP